MNACDEIVVGPFWGAQFAEDDASSSSILSFPEFMFDFAGSGPQEIIPLETLNSTELEFERFSNFVEENSNGQSWSSRPEYLTFHSHEEPDVPLPPLPVNSISRTRGQKYDNDNDDDQQSSSLDEDMDIYDRTDMTSDSSDDEDSNQMTSISGGHRRQQVKQPSSLKKEGVGGKTKVKVKNVTVDFITNQSERKVRFILGIHTIFVKVRGMENQTGSKGVVKALYENREYTQEDVEEFVQNFKKGQTRGTESSIDDIETSRPTSEELEDDHRYAATILTQKVSSTSLHDHQYNEVTSSGRSKRMRMREAWYQEYGATRAQPKHERCNFIRTKSKRERTLLEFLDTIYPKIKRIETRTKANIELSVIYGNHTFTSENYTKAEGMLRKNKLRVLRPRVPHVAATVRRIPENTTTGTLNTLYVRFPRQLNIKPSPTTEPNVAVINELQTYSSASTIDLGPVPLSLPMTPPVAETISETPKVLATWTTTSTNTENLAAVNANPEVICRKCSRNVPPHQDGPSRRPVTWIRCADALCHYMIHSSCIGFYVHHPRDLRRLPPFYCETHRDWDEY